MSAIYPFSKIYGIRMISNDYQPRTHMRLHETILIFNDDTSTWTKLQIQTKNSPSTQSVLYKWLCSLNVYVCTRRWWVVWRRISLSVFFREQIVMERCNMCFLNHNNDIIVLRIIRHLNKSKIVDDKNQVR